MTGAPIDASNTDNSEVAEESNSDEAIPSVAKYSNKMKLILKKNTIQRPIKRKWTLILKILKIENGHKHYAKQWRTIYDVIQQDFFD